MGYDGKQGPAGPAGPEGPQGPKGDPGDPGSGTAYVLPAATTTTLGGVKVGAGLAVTADGTLSSGAGVANPVAGSVAGLTMWVGTQAAYDAIGTKDTKTVYNVTA